MKNMFKKIFLAVIAVVVAFSCNEDDNSHLKIPMFVSGGTVRAVVPAENAFLDVTNLGSAKYVMDLTAYDFEDGNLIQSYDIYVEYYQASSDNTFDERLYGKITEFPSRVEITAAQFAQLFELPGGVNDLGGGDLFNFRMEVTMKDGRVFTAENTSDDIALENNSRGTFFLTTFVGCPFVTADAVGTYHVTRDDFETLLDPDHEFEVIAGPGADQVTMKNLFGHPQSYDVIATVDPATGHAVIAKQAAWHCANFGCGFGVGSVQGEGTWFSCTGFASFDLTHTVAAGSFGSYRLEIQKN